MPFHFQLGEVSCPVIKNVLFSVGGNWSESNLLKLLLNPLLPQDKTQYKKPYKYLKSIACKCTSHKSEGTVAVLSHDCSPDVPLRTHTSLQEGAALISTALLHTDETWSRLSLCFSSYKSNQNEIKRECTMSVKFKAFSSSQVFTN